MNILLIEVCLPNHYITVYGLIKTYSVLPNSNITVICTPEIQEAICESGELPSNVEFVLFKDSKSFHAVIDPHLNVCDRVHICTMDRYFYDFLKLDYGNKEVILHIHNIDAWFAFKIRTEIKNFLEERKQKIFSTFRLSLRYTRDIVLFHPIRQKFLYKIEKGKYKFLVHSSGQVDYLRNFVKGEHILVFPFAIHENIKVKSNKSDKIQICIPGIISNRRREYSVLFDILKRNCELFKNKYIFQFLGYIPKEEIYLEKQINELQGLGLNVHYFKKFVYGKEFDEILFSSDILLNNQKVKHLSTKVYGVTKDSGMIFNMIKAGLPGILPQSYLVDLDIKACCINYDKIDDLERILIETSKADIDSIKLHMSDVVNKYTSQKLLTQLVKDSFHSVDSTPKK